MLTTPWDDKTLDKTEIKAMEREHREYRITLRKLSLKRVGVWYLDLNFFQALRKGESPAEAREYAINAIGAVKGFVFGVGFTLIMLTLAAYIWGQIRVGDWLGAGYVLLGAVAGVCWGVFGLTKGFKWLYRKVRRSS